MVKKPMSARSKPGKGESSPVVIEIDDFEVEVAFDQPGEAKSASGSLKNAWFDLTKPGESSSGQSIVSNPG